ncbi:MAG: hypothetical protein ABI262_21155 [Microcoleus sp.]
MTYWIWLWSLPTSALLLETGISFAVMAGRYQSSINALIPVLCNCQPFDCAIG